MNVQNFAEMIWLLLLVIFNLMLFFDASYNFLENKIKRKTIVEFVVLLIEFIWLTWFCWFR